MPRESHESDLAILLGLFQEFHGPARGEHVVNVLHVHHVVDLVEVDIVGLQPRQALVQVQFAVAVGAIAGLRSENVLVPRHTLKSDPVPSLAQPIGPSCRGVEIVDPGLIAGPDRAQSLRNSMPSGGSTIEDLAACLIPSFPESTRLEETLAYGRDGPALHKSFPRGWPPQVA